MEKQKKYTVSINYGLVILAKNEEEAKEQFNNILDSTSFKLDVTEIK